MLSESMQICVSQSPLLKKCNKGREWKRERGREGEGEAQAAADSAAASSAGPASLPETIKTELLGADGLVASGGAAS